jgi:hypothetical protein
MDNSFHMNINLFRNPFHIFRIKFLLKILSKDIQLIISSISYYCQRICSRTRGKRFIRSHFNGWECVNSFLSIGFYADHEYEIKFLFRLSIIYKITIEDYRSTLIVIRTKKSRTLFCSLNNISKFAEF